MNKEKKTYGDLLNLQECIKQLVYLFKHDTGDKSRAFAVQHTIFAHYFNILREQPEYQGIDESVHYHKVLDQMSKAKKDKKATCEIIDFKPFMGNKKVKESCIK